MVAETAKNRTWPAVLQGRELYHAAPLHYVPSIFQDGALYAKSVLAAKGIAPRATARRRDHMLALQDYVHFSFQLPFPLLADKLKKGFPHVVLVFDAAALAQMPGHALLPYNTKAWRTRSACIPVAEDALKARLLRRHDLFGELPSMEFLVKYAVGIESLSTILFFTPREEAWVKELCGALSIPLNATVKVEEALAPANYGPATSQAIEDYFLACRERGQLLPPPDIPFD